MPIKTEILLLRTLGADARYYLLFLLRIKHSCIPVYMVKYLSLPFPSCLLSGRTVHWLLTDHLYGALWQPVKQQLYMWRQAWQYNLTPLE